MGSYKKKQRQLQKKLNAELKQRAKSLKKAPKTSQQTLPFKTIFPDGICEIDKGYYSKTIGFSDVNYQTSRLEHKLSFFDMYSSFINYFTDDVDVQITLINSFIDRPALEKKIMLPLREDILNLYRSEFNEMLSNQIQQGKNNIRRTKFLTFSIHSDSEEHARQKLNMIETDLLNNFKEKLGSSSHCLNGMQRIELLHDIYRQGSGKHLDFDYDLIFKSGLSVKDFIAPNSFSFRNSDDFMMGDVMGRVSFLRVTASELTDDFLSELASLENNLIITINLKNIKQESAIKTIKQQFAMMESDKVKLQIKASKSGYDPELISPDLKRYLKETESFINDLESRDQKMFQCSILILNTSKNREELDNVSFRLQTIAEKHSCDLQPLEEQQEAALASIVPVGVNRLEVNRTLSTESVAILVPFVAVELFDEDGEYYGLNPISRNMILINRTKGNPNGLILGMPNSGKSFAAKREMVSVLLSSDDDIIVLDPDREYSPLAHLLGGEVVKVSAGSATHINPLDINENYSDGDDPLIMKSEFILSLCEALIGGHSGLRPKEKTIIDRCVKATYLKYLQDMDKYPVPTLNDFYEVLLNQNEPEAQDIAVSLELYIKGSLSVFANPTNVDISNRFVVYDIKDLGKGLQTMGMLIVLDQIWNRVTSNRAKGRRTRIILDEFSVYLRNEYSSDYFYNVWKRIRKYGGVPTAITQNVSDFLSSNLAETIFSNSAFIQMLNQAPADRDSLAKILSLSEQQLSHITNTLPGQGLLYFEGALIPFVDKFPTDTELYKAMTTKPNEIAEYMRQEKEKRVRQVS